MPGISSTQTGFTQESFESFLAERREPAWLTALRREAWAEFQRLPMPDRKLEEWMRTDIRGFHLDHFGFPSPLLNGSSLPRAVLNEGVALAGSTATIDSRPCESSLDPALARQGVLFGSLDTLVAEHGNLLRPAVRGR